MTLIQVLTIAVFIIIAITLALVKLLGKRSNKDLQRLANLIQRFNDGDDAPRLELKRSDHLLSFVQAFESLLNRQRDDIECLEENKSRLKLVIDGASLGYWDWNYQTGDYLVNGRWLEMLGLDAEIFKHHVDDWRQRINPLDAVRVDNIIEAHIKSGKSFVDEFRMRHEEGHWVWVQCSGSVVSYDKQSGEALRLCGTYQDITERKLAERQLKRSEGRLKLSQRIAQMGSWRWQVNNDEVWWSDFMYDLYGIPRKSKPPTPYQLEPFIHPADRDAVFNALEGLKKGEAAELEYRINDAQGMDRHLYCYALPRSDDEGMTVSVDGILMDVSERRRSEERQRLAQAMFENASEGMLVTDGEARIVAVNRTFTEITGYQESEVMGLNPNILQSGEQGEAFYKQMWGALAEQGRWQGEVWNRKKNGVEYPEWLSISVVKDDDGQVVNYIGAFTDISKIKESERRLNYLAHHDPLTDLPNRLLFTARLKHSMQQTTRRREELALLFVDLDNFKHINDSLGHAMGDEVLQLVSCRLKGAVRGNDTVARLGGDEFAVVLESASDRDAVGDIANKLLKLISEPVEIGGHQLYLGASIGISFYPSDGDDVTELLKNADAAMYQAKEGGRNTYKLFDSSMTSKIFERLLLESSLRQAVNEGQLIVYYQPKHDLESGAIVGAEALLRWRHPTTGMVPPSRFIPLAEESGLIVQIGEWVLREACRDMVELHEEGMDFGHMAVNLSAVQLIQPGIVDVVRQVLEETGCRGEWLELEVTEGCIMHGAEGIITVLEDFRTMGIKLAIDDFGTGYSSLSYLKRLPIDVLKVDKSFVDGIPNGEDDVAISQAIIALGKSLRLTLVAEGIETEAQHVFLADQGCEYGQGYVFSPAVALEDFKKLLSESRK